MRPVLAGFQSGSVLAWRGRERLTAAAALHAARKLAAALPPGQHVLNLCESLDRFIVATITALVAGRTLVLPPTRLGRTLDRLRADLPDSVCLFDSYAGDDGSTFGVDRWIEAALREPSASVDVWPAVADAHTAAILFTSGSTGAPQPHRKSWGELCDGARALMGSIARPAPDVAILGTVPPQHMFGFETTVMLPLQSGIPVIAAQPQFAGDLVDVLRDVRAVAAGGAWLMTTPLQLRGFHRERCALQGIGGVIASTMPLDGALARDVERDWNTTVHEIYGCTEGGMLAVRRPGTTSTWTPAAGIAFEIADDGKAQVSGGHVGATLCIADRLRRVADNGDFELIGRDADLVKIGGKRASLAGLTRELVEIAGVRDGVVFLPADNAPRVAALAVAPGIEIEALRRELAQRIDPAFMPRPLLLVDALPRNPAGKLPLDALRARVSAARATAATPSHRAQALTAQLRFGRDHPALAGHFPGRPIVPGVLLLASVEDLLRDSGLRVVECAQAKFLVPVLPEQQMTIRVDVDETRAARFLIVAGHKTVASGTLRCVRAEAGA